MRQPTTPRRRTAGRPAASPKPHLSLIPGRLVVRWKHDVLRSGLGRHALRAMPMALPEQARASLEYLRRNFGLKRVIPIETGVASAPQPPGRSGASRHALGIARSLQMAPGALRGVTVLEIDRRADARKALRHLKDGAIAYAQAAPARWASAAAPADPRYNAQWGLPAIEWFLANRPDARSLRVAVLDSGVDRGHPDLKGVVATYDHRGSSSADLEGHGTHVAGIIAAKANNRIGIAGVASCRLCCWKVFADQTEADGNRYVDSVAYYRALEAVIRTYRRRRIRAVNLSLGGDTLDRTEADLLATLLQQQDAPLVVSAMGNEYREGNPIEYPAALPGVLAVGAVGLDRRRAWFSNTGRHIGLVAPGEAILSTLPTRRAPGRDETDYAAWDGTSMATPFVAGVAVLVAAKHPTLTTSQLRQRLVGKTTRLKAMGRKRKTPAYGSGLLNLRKALT